MDTAKKVDPEDEKKLVEFIRSELLRGQDPKSIRVKLIQAGWAEADVLRLINVATAKPDFKASAAVKPVDLEAVLVFQKDGNLKLQRELIDAQLRKKREEELPILKPKATVVKERKLSLEEKVRMARRAVQVALMLLLVYHAWLIQQKFMG